MTEEEDMYELSSSESEDDLPKKPIKIEGRSGDLKQLKSALFENRGPTKDESRDEELAALKEAKELKKMKKDFEDGSISNRENEEDEAVKIARLEERQRLTEIGKEKYSKFKDKFEKLDSTLDEHLEEKKKKIQHDTIGLGKETLASAKERFEKGESDVIIEKSKVEIERSADLKNMKAAFILDQKPQEEKKDCEICSKVVYPVEKILANKKLYHIACFKCSKCAKKLSPTTFNSHEGKLLCKVHMLEVFHPELAKNLDPATTEEDEHGNNSDEEFAVSSKPKQLQGVVKSGTNAVHDELAQIRSLKEKKGDFESSIKEAENVEKKTQIDKELLAAGKVKANAERFISGAALEQSDDEIESDRDPSIIRNSKKPQREELNFQQVGDIKNKWKTGDVETAEGREASERKELEALKGGISVKERFRERNEEESNVEKQWNREQLDTSAAAEARKSFMAGKAYEGAQVEKTARDLEELQFGQLKGVKERFEKGEDDVEIQKTQVEVDGVQLGNLKANFEKGEEPELTTEERAELKKKEIEAEFLRYKLARKAAKNAENEAAEHNESADVGSIKNRFDQGHAFKAQAADEKQLDVEVKIAGKAREKFMEIDASGAAPVAPGLLRKATEPSKWDKKDDKPVAEVINRRVQDEEPEAEDDDSFDVKNLMNKFKNIGESSSQVKNSSEHRAELEALKTEAKNFKAKFEKGSDDGDNISELKRQQMEEEFEAMKREREEAQRRLDEERRAEEQDSRSKEARDEEVAIKADHASKMAAKWEKIQQKEAKKAEKGKMPEKRGVAKFIAPVPEKCSTCKKSVYRAEQFQCFGNFYHLNCFRCVECKQPLRVEKVQRSKEGDLYCRVHFKLMEEKSKRKEIDLEDDNNNIAAEQQEDAPEDVVEV